MASYPSWLPADERKDVRLQVSVQVSIAAPAIDTFDAAMTDVSCLGCRLHTARQINVGTFLTLAVADCASVTGWVAWRKGSAAGVDFAHPLPDEVVASLIALGVQER